MTERTILDELQYEQLPAILVGAIFSHDIPFGDDPLDELADLAETAGMEVVGRVTQKLQRIHAATYIGKGKVEELKELVRETGAKAVIFDNELRPAQQKKVETAVEASVIDRTELILTIFANHARTHQAKVQVELARLEYELPRLKNLWSHLERQRGALATVGGAGERQIETDRRLLRKRIHRMRGELEGVERRRQVEVERRSELFQVAIVGYTNSGKSTLMNALTGEDVLMQDKLFATLDTRTCVWQLADHKVLLSDTVGFLRNLPHRLVASFHATLEEVCQADLLLHVVDAAHPAAEEMIHAVNGVLKGIGADDRRVLTVFNKIDRVRDRPLLHRLHEIYPSHVDISAISRAGLSELAQRVQQVVEERETALDWTFSAGNGKLLAYLKQHGKIIEIAYDENEVKVKALMEPRFLGTAMQLRDA